MPLIACPMCEKSVSDKAAFCPSCGHPISATGGQPPAGGPVPRPDPAVPPDDGPGVKPSPRKPPPQPRPGGPGGPGGPDDDDGEENGGDGAGASPNPLPVTLIGQETRLWCWAASAQMIMQYLGHPPLTQCDEASRYFGNAGCCGSPTPDACVNGGWPQFDQYGYSAERYPPPPAGPGVGALSWEDLKYEIDHNRPFAFSWHRTLGGGHMMVVTGYQVIAGKNWVTINDPWPPNEGAKYPIPYETFVSGPPGYEHWYDYYKVVPGPGGQAPGGVEAPGGPTDPSVRDQSRPVAEAFLGTALQATGQDAPGALDRAYVEEGFPVVEVGLDQLRQDAPGGAPEDLVTTQARQVIYPISMAGKPVASTMVEKNEDQEWVARVGNPAWTNILVKVRARHAAINDTPLDSYFLIDAGALGLYFLGIKMGRYLQAIPTLDEPSLGLKAGEALPIEKAYEILKKVATSHNGGPA